MVAYYVVLLYNVALKIQIQEALVDKQELVELKARLRALKARHRCLLNQCGGGKEGKTAPSDERLIKAGNSREFCAICASNKKEIDFLLKLFELKEWFFDNAPVEPIADSEEGATDYLSNCKRLLLDRVQEIPLDDIRHKARDSVAEFACHFSGKLIHSSAIDSHIMAPDLETAQPHISSRRLRACGIKLKLDYGKNDGDGKFQRLLKVINNDPSVAETHLPDTIIEALKSGASDGLHLARASRRDSVDHRLRQILLPTGGGYVSLSPIPAGGLIHEFAEKVGEFEKIEKDNDDLKNDLRAAKTKATRLPADFTLPDSWVIHASNIRPGLSVEQIRSIGEKFKQHWLNVTGNEGLKQNWLESWIKWIKSKLLVRVQFALGGNNPYNISAYGVKGKLGGFQWPLYFEAPQKDENTTKTWRFIFRRWSPSIRISDASKIAEHIEAMESSTSLSNSTSLMAVDIQSSGPLAYVVRDCDRQAKDLNSIISQSSFSEEGQRLQIDADLLSSKRADEIDDLDLSIVRGDFGANYRESLARAIVISLGTLTSKKDSGQSPFHSEAVRNRVRRAAINILEDIR